MKKIALIRLTICLILAIVLSISSLTLADIASGTDKQAERHFEKANELLKRMDYEAAIAEYKKVLNISSNSKIAQDAQYWIGQSHFRAGQFDAAQATFTKLVERYPTSAIVPVTKLMVERVQQAKENEEKRRAMSNTADKGYIIDPETGVKYTKIATFAGKNDVIKWNVLDLSPNGKFLLHEGIVVPLDGSEPFDLVDGYVFRGVWSPDGTKVAFCTRGAICIVPVSPETGRATGPVRKLLEGSYSRTCVTWSPDGQKLAFERHDEEHDGGIWTVSVTDGSLTQITEDGGPGAKKWSPDGKTILYGIIDYGRGFVGLCTISADGGGSRKVVAPLERPHYPPFDWYWSWDGRWILYYHNEIHLLNVDDNRRLDLALPPREVGSFFSWSPDGKKMLFCRESYEERAGLKLVSASGGPHLDIGKKINSDGTAVWSPDSKMIATRGRDEDGKNLGIWIISLSGDDPVPLEIDVSVDGKPIFFEVSPTGQKLAFVVDREDETRDLYVVPVSLKDARATGPAVKVFEGWNPRYASDLTYMEASWSPDGNKLAVIHRGDIWIAYSNGDKPIQLTHEIGAFYPGWSPDGTMVDYMAWPKEGGGLYVIPSRGGNPTKVRTAYWWNSVWSPDSKRLAIVSKEGSISMVTVANGKTQEIATLKDLGLARLFYLEWSPDGKYIACDGDEPNQKQQESGTSLILIPVEGGKPTVLAADDDSWKFSLHWSPDGKWITYRSQGPVKVRPEGILWEADFEEIVKKASR